MMRIGFALAAVGLLLATRVSAEGGDVALEIGANAAASAPAAAAEIAVLRYDGRDDGLLRVRIEINDKPVQVVLDSAADRIYLPQQIAASLDLVATGRSLETTTGSGDVRTDVLHVDRLRIGGHELRGLVAGVAPSLTYALVGQSVLSCFKWSVDPGEQTIQLERVSVSPHCRADES